MPVEMHQNERPLEESDNDLNTRNKWKTTSQVLQIERSKFKL